MLQRWNKVTNKLHEPVKSSNPLETKICNIIKGIKQMENLLIGSLTSRRLQAFKCFVAAVQCRLYCHFTSMVKRPCEQQRFVFLKTTKELLGSKMENTLSI